MGKKAKRKLKVNKIFLTEKVKDYPPRFKDMPILYLEYLENKSKVKPELRNKQYVPRSMHTTTIQTGKEDISDVKLNDDGDEKKDRSVDTLLDFTEDDSRSPKGPRT